jgi:hypothetical protein
VRRFLATLVVLELVVGVVALAAPDIDKWLQERIDPVLEAGDEADLPPTGSSSELKRDQAEVAGTVTKLVAQEAVGPVLSTPLSIEAGTRGVTRAVITDALVGGERVTISWDGGAPLPLTGEGGLRLGPAPVQVDGNGITWGLEGAPRRFVAGSYRVNFDVGVGREGIASVRPGGVAFEADDRTGLQVTRGGAFVRRPAAEITLEGAEPAAALLEGELTLRTADETGTVAAVIFGPGDYEITLTPTTGGYTIRGLLEGPIEI